MMKFKKKYILQKSDAKIRRIPGASYLIDGDSYGLSDEKLIVFDGVTRDFTNGEVLRIPKTLRELSYLMYFFPDMRGLRTVGDLCAVEFINSDEKDLRELVKTINEIPKDYYTTIYDGIKPDFLGRDYYCFSAAGGAIEEDRLKVFNISDSNITLLSKDLEIVQSTKDNYQYTSELRETVLRNMFPDIEHYWNNDKFRSLYRKLFRNTNNSMHSYGVLNGEEVALDFVNYYDFDLTDVEYILAYTDGYKNIIANPDLRRSILNREKVLPEKEGTLLGMQKVYK